MGNSFVSCAKRSEATRRRRGGFQFEALDVLIWFLPLGAAVVAFAANGVVGSLSLQYLQAMAVSLLITLTLALLEHVLPASGPRKGSPQILLDLEVGILFFLGVTLAGALAGFLASVVGRRVDMGWIDVRFRSRDNPLVLVATLLMSWLIYDCFFYWYHRSQHTFSLLWQVHKFHHMDEQLSVTTRLRDNLSDTFISIFFISIPIALLFRFDPVTTAKLSTFTKLGSETVGVFIHSNIRLHLGWASAIVVGPQLHRIHHSRLTQHHNRNFCVYFPIWDILFGTYYHPSPAEFPLTGIDEASDVGSIREVVAIPFRGWWAILCGWRQRRT